MVLRGRLLFFTFHANGTLLQCTALGPGDAEADRGAGAPPALGVDIAAGTFHSATAAPAALGGGGYAVVWEQNAPGSGGFKGPGLSKQMAPWAPAEAAPGAGAYLERLLDACEGPDGLVPREREAVEG